VSKRIFISCGQYTEAEKRIGTRIADLVRSAGFEPFFAEEVHDLVGLDRNILDALHECVAFIVVLHPRGTVTRPDTSFVTRASVWIEQEIAIAAYIRHVENRPLQVIAFKHFLVDREGLRDVLQLNPIEFKNESEVLAALPELLRKLRPMAERPAARSSTFSQARYVEWQKLDEVLRASTRAMGYAFVPFNAFRPGDERNDPSAAMQRGYDALNGSLLIADALANNGVMKKWDALVLYVHSRYEPREPDQRGAPTEIGFDIRAKEFLKDLGNAAREDLGGEPANI
jgi:hypothetical protein